MTLFGPSDPRERYRNDAEFHALVEQIRAWISRCQRVFGSVEVFVDGKRMTTFTSIEYGKDSEIYSPPPPRRTVGHAPRHGHAQPSSGHP